MVPSRIYFEDKSMQANNMDPALATALGSPNGKGNRTNQYEDYGFEVGGPILKDHLWGWGSIGKTDVRILTIKQTPDRTILDNYAAKVSAQGSPSASAAALRSTRARNRNSAVAQARRIRRRRPSISPRWATASSRVKATSSSGAICF